MAAAKKALSPAQARERRAKIAALVLGVVFLGVAGIQGPKLMKQLSGKHSNVVAAVAVAPAATGGSPSLASSAVSAGRLTHFGRFAMKDPFHALVKDASPAGGTAGASGPAGAGTAAGQLSVVPGAKNSGSTATFTQTPGTATPGGPVVPAALILFNGKKQLVILGGTFPAKNPVFRLVSLSLKNVKIGLVGGSFANGKTTLALPRGHKVKLANSSTGDKFVLVLVKLTTAAKPLPSTPPPAIGGVGGASTTTTSTTTTPTTTTTTTSG
jgi:hypothetical protein